MSYDLAAEPTGVQWRQCSYFRRLRAQWMRPGSSSVEINLHYDALATEPTGVQWRQCSYFRHLRAQWMRPGSSRSTYATMLLLQTYGPRGCYQVKRRDQPPQRVVDIHRVDYDVLASDVWWHSLTGVEKNLLLSKFKVKTICIDVRGNYSTMVTWGSFTRSQTTN